MKNFLLTTILVLGMCAAAFGAFYATSSDRAARRALNNGDTLAWLRTEFHLNAAQFAEINRLHATFQDRCAEHCMAIIKARRALREAATPAAIAACEANLQRLEASCVDEMLAHFRRVAALMPPGQGERYLAMILPRVGAYDHAGAPDLQAQP